MVPSFILVSVLLAVGTSKLLYGFIVNEYSVWETVCVVFASCLTGCLSFICYDIGSCSLASSHTSRTLTIQYIYTKLAQWYGKIRHDSFVTDVEDLADLQEALLKGILIKNADTTYGRLYRIKDLKTKEDFIKMLPLTSYKDFEYFIERVGKGAEGVLTSEPTKYFTVTSGETGKEKRFPITSSHVNNIFFELPMALYKEIHHYKTLRRLSIIRLLPKLKYTSCGTEVASISHYITRIPAFNVTPPSCYQISNEKSALYVHALFTLAERDIAVIDAMTATTMYYFFKTIRQKSSQLCEDIRHGQVSRDLDLSDDLRTEIDKALPADEKRADEIEKEINSGSASLARRLWTNLKYVQMACTGNMTHYAKCLEETYLKGVLCGSYLHLSSEGLIGVNITSPDSCYNSVYAFSTRMTFFEFIPEEEIGSDHPTTLFIGQVEKGKRYEVVVTTDQGLYRYRLGDVIEVVDFVKQCPVYRFCYRLDQLLTLEKERTPENIVYEALCSTVNQLEAVRFVDYTATDNVSLDHVTGTTSGGKKFYVVFLEVQRSGREEQLKECEISQFDKNLCDLSQSYAELREKGELEALQIIQVRQNTFSELMELMLETISIQQFKMPRVIRKQDHITFLLQQRI